MGKPTIGIAVDGNCLGNPGQASYRAVDIATGKELFKFNIGEATNNIAEFFAICNAIYYKKVTKSDLPIYSDSLTAIYWVKNRRCNSTYSNLFIDSKIKQAEEFLKEIGYVHIEKWKTKEWGENVADFGLKNK